MSFNTLKSTILTNFEIPQFRDWEFGTPLIQGFGIGEKGRDPGIRDPGIANTSCNKANMRREFVSRAIVIEAISLIATQFSVTWSVVCHIHTPCSNGSTDLGLDAIWQVQCGLQWHIVSDEGSLTPGKREILKFEPLSQNLSTYDSPAKGQLLPTCRQRDIDKRFVALQSVEGIGSSFRLNYLQKFITRNKKITA